MPGPRTVAAGALVAALASAAILLPDWLRHGGPGSESSYAAEARGHVAPMTLGMNLGSMKYLSQEFPFVDIIQQSQFLVQPAGGRYVPLESGAVPLDAGGHPVGVPEGTKISVMIKSGGGHRLPSGTYACRISPGWTIRPSAAATIDRKGGGFTMTVVPSPSDLGLRLTLVATGKSDLTELSCRQRGAAPGAIFNPVFLAGLKPFSVVRFMDWMKTNGQQPFAWNQRTTPASLTQASTRGVSVETMVALANTAGLDPWFTQPLEADDSTYRGFATLVRDQLAPGRKAYVEVSNEVWNAGFKQAKRAQEQGKLRYPDAEGGDPASFYYADRVRAVMAIWSEVFKGQEGRIVRVLATQAGSTKRATASLSHADTARSVDALAIAPYFGPNPSEPTMADGDPTEYVLAHGPEFVDRAIKHGLASKAVADKFGLPLITYEGGPAYISVRPRLNAAFATAQDDPRMETIYTDFLTRWRDQVGGLFVAFDFVNHGFGHLDYIGQPLDEAPKMRALVKFSARDKFSPRDKGSIRANR